MKSPPLFHRALLLSMLDVKPHVLRGWLKLEPLVSRETKERSASAYSTLDFLFLLVVQELDLAGFELKALKTFSRDLHQRLGQPAGKDDTFTIHFKGGRWKTGPAGDAGGLELKVPLTAARQQVLEYTDAPTVSGQREMALLIPVRAGQRGRRA